MKERVPVEALLQVSRYHREHERYYSWYYLDLPARLKREANTLKTLADHWLRPSAATEGPAELDSRFAAAGCPDLNELLGVAQAGVLFMEGEAEPAELTRLQNWLRFVVEDLRRHGTWLAEKMQAGWKRERALLRPGWAAIVAARYRVLASTTLGAHRMLLAAELLTSALRGFQALDLQPSAVRGDPAANAMRLRDVGWLLDAAASVLATKAIELSEADVNWTIYNETLANPGSGGADA